MTEKLLSEANRFALRSACRDCFYLVRRTGRCAHEWPNREQSRWPLDQPNERGQTPDSAPFCKEFELA